jgi:hypothetical protein
VFLGGKRLHITRKTAKEEKNAKTSKLNLKSTTFGVHWHTYETPA